VLKRIKDLFVSYSYNIFKLLAIFQFDSQPRRRSRWLGISFLLLLLVLLSHKESEHDGEIYRKVLS
jgi:hypothetical protein